MCDLRKRPAHLLRQAPHAALIVPTKRTTGNSARDPFPSLPRSLDAQDPRHSMLCMARYRADVLEGPTGTRDKRGTLQSECAVRFWQQRVYETFRKGEMSLPHSVPSKRRTGCGDFEPVHVPRISVHQGNGDASVGRDNQRGVDSTINFPLQARSMK